MDKALPWVTGPGLSNLVFHLFSLVSWMNLGKPLELVHAATLMFVV